MKHFSVLLAVLTFFFASLGGLNFLNYVTNLSVSPKFSETIKSPPSLPLDAVLDISLRSGSTTLGSFSAELKITTDEYLFLKTSGLADFFRTLTYTDFSALFSNFDSTWWSIDLWNKTLSNQLGADSASVLRTFVEDLSSYDRSTSPTFRYSLEDNLFLEIKTTFPTTAFSAPDEYLDFSDYFTETFELDFLADEELSVEDNDES